MAAIAKDTEGWHLCSPINSRHALTSPARQDAGRTWAVARPLLASAGGAVGLPLLRCRALLSRGDSGSGI
ncbi:hypothetical protein E2C01_093892 [Portunus trituberculatus]|uniref:Uncharacterized protein n=1 Tax=Portunus trituberculatus TaxID=210409 RepID=A0A5B7JUP9_PORTR|nr:hypothetical protein [Portunus trituberculatus]